MVHKLIGFYGDRLEYTPNRTDQLAIDAIELYQIDQSNADWSDILFEVKQNSKILGPTYSDCFVYFNFEEALILPMSEMSASASADYLSLIYGTDERADTKFDRINSTLPTVTIYRIKKSLTELLDRNFLIFKIQHTYTNILNDVLNRDSIPAIFLKMIVYQKHMIIVLVKDNQLQLIQTYRFLHSDDILYFAISITNQTGVSPLETELELSGLVDLQNSLLDQLKKSFGIVNFDVVNHNGINQASPSNYSPYFLTPFYKLLA
jgi:hypothetical protein